jgi:hypothetical protein
MNLQTLTRFGALAAVLALAACANTPSQPPGNGRFLVSDNRGASGYQFEYPNEKLCRDTEKRIRDSGGKATCQTETAESAFKAKATLRYNPPGVLVHGHYGSLDFCRSQTARPSPGVEVINACSAT